MGRIDQHSMLRSFSEEGLVETEKTELAGKDSSLVKPSVHDKI